MGVARTMTTMVNPRKGPKPAALRGKTMKKTSTKRKPRRRKNPGGLFSMEGAKQSLQPMAIGAAYSYVQRQGQLDPSKMEFWHKLSDGKKALALYAAAQFARKKGKAEHAGACLALAGIHAERFWQARKAKKAGGAALNPEMLQVAQQGAPLVKQGPVQGVTYDYGSGYGQVGDVGQLAPPPQPYAGHFDLSGYQQYASA